MTEEIATPLAAPLEIAGIPPQPALGDVVDALDDAAASLKVVARHETRALLCNVRAVIRARPIKVVAWVAGAAYLIGRFAR